MISWSQDSSLGESKLYLSKLAIPTKLIHRNCEAEMWLFLKQRENRENRWQQSRKAKEIDMCWWKLLHQQLHFSVPLPILIFIRVLWSGGLDIIGGVYWQLPISAAVLANTCSKFHNLKSYKRSSDRWKDVWRQTCKTARKKSESCTVHSQKVNDCNANMYDLPFCILGILAYIIWRERYCFLLKYFYEWCLNFICTY